MNLGGALADHQRGRDLAIAFSCASNWATSRSRSVRGSSECASERSARASAGAADWLSSNVAPTFDTVRDLTRPAAIQRVPELSQPVLDLSIYDQLLVREVAHG